MSNLLNCRRASLLSPYCRNFGDSATRLCILSRYFLVIISSRSLSSVEEERACGDKQRREVQRHTFTVSYLVNSCGLSLETAESKYRYVKFDSPAKPDSVISMLKKQGFTDDQIGKVIKSFPAVLVLDTERILLPKLMFLHEIGFSRTDRAKFISSHPSILGSSLNNTLIPCYNFIKSILSRGDLIVRCLKRSHRILHINVQKDLAPKVSILGAHGVPQANIKILIRRHPDVLSLAAKTFDESLKKTMSLGFDPLKVNFVEAIIAISGMQESNWERKIEVYKRWGWSEDDVYSAFKKFPNCMTYSEKKITSTMDLLVNKMGLQPSSIAKSPRVLGQSLEKSTIPRCMVIAVLLSKGVLKKEDVNYLGLLPLSGQRFRNRVVIKYQEHVPQLLSIMEKKMSPQDLGVLCENLIG